MRCHGDVRTADLLEWTAASAKRPLALIAPQSCESCPAGDGDSRPPGEDARRQTTALLADMRLAEFVPTVVQLSVGGDRLDHGAARFRSRRAFLRRVAGSRDQEELSPGTNDPSTKRRATLQALRRLAAAFDVGLPASFFPALSADDRCAGHGVCVASCTAGALRWFEADGLRGVEFDAERCTACGDCVERCPEQALTLKANGNGTVPTATLRLSAHALRVCERCEDEFTEDEDDVLCPGCRKDIGLFNDLATAGRGGATEDEEIKTEVTT